MNKSTLPAPDALPTPSSLRSGLSRLADRAFVFLCQGCGWSMVVIVLALIAMLSYLSWPVLSRAGHYQIFTSSNWNPTAATPVYGSLVFVYGTLATSLIAMLIAVPLGVGTAAFLSEIAPGWMRRICSFLSELLAAIPSVVFGFWGLFFIAPVLQKFFTLLGGPNTASGQGILSAGIVLALMILPYITAISFDVCRAVPSSQRQGALALGATRWQTIWTVVLPYARPGIVAACFLALGRALGETMAVTMLIGNVRYLNFSLFATGDSIASIIAGQLNEADGTTRSALIALGLILFLITAFTNIVGRYFIQLTAGSHRRKSIALTQTTASYEPGLPSNDSAKFVNRMMTGVLGLCQILTIIPLFLILGYILYRGAPSVDANLFTQRPMPPNHPGGGLGHAMLGSLIMVLMASAIAVPIAIMAAVYLSEYRTHWSTKPIRFMTELLGGVPSIVIGVFAYSIVVFPPWQLKSNGFSAWAGIFALGVMMLPVVVRTTEEALKLVPGSLRQASYALGATQAQTVLRVIIPAAFPAIITGVLLAMGRIAGETAPLLLTARDSQFWPRSLSRPMASLPFNIYDYSTSPYPERQKLAWAAALVLLTFVVVLNVSMRLLAGKRMLSASRAD